MNINIHAASPVPAGQHVRVFAPATVANMICGYDILGFALDEPGDEVAMRLSSEPGVRVVSITGDDGKLPYDADKNTVSASVQHWLKAIGKEQIGLDITLHKRMPIGSGLGSSAASTVAGLYAANLLLGEPMSVRELLPFAMLGEELACGNGHADNVAPALFGGVTLIRSYEPLEVLPLPVPQGLMAAVVFPHVEVPTRDARRMIKESVPLPDAVTQWGNIAGLVAGLYTDDHGLIGRCMQDVIIEPARSILIPGFDEMRRLAMGIGALSFGISGSGPSVFALAEAESIAVRVAGALQDHLATMGIGSDTYVSAINTVGPRVLEFDGQPVAAESGIKTI